MGDTIRVTCDLQATESLQIAIGLLIMDRVTINTYDKSLRFLISLSTHLHTCFSSGNPNIGHRLRKRLIIFTCFSCQITKPNLLSWIVNEMLGLSEI